MQVNKISNQNFGMALKCNPGLGAIKIHIAQKHGDKKVLKSYEMLDELAQNKALTQLSLENKNNNDKLIAVVGDKIFKENFFNSPYRVLKKAVKESKEQNQIELIANVLKILSKDLD